MLYGTFATFGGRKRVRAAVTASLYLRWRRGPNGRLLAEVGELRLEAYRYAKQARAAGFAVLRRQYGRGSPFALIASGSAVSLFAAMRAAEQASARFL